MVYINGIGSVSIQSEKGIRFPDWNSDNYLRCVEPDFAQFISPVLSRRMSKIIKRSIVASKICLQDAQMEMPDAIISGTGLGCMEETEKFLLSMIEQKESLLQPTHFIQSTHNTISSQIAMNLKCYSYNSTYSHLGTSFESALLDAFLQIKAHQIKSALVGGFDEMTPDYKNMLAKIGYVKKDKFTIEDMRKAKTPGSALGEGSNCIFLSSEKNNRSYATILDMHICQTSHQDTMIKQFVFDFLAKNNLNLSEIDAVMMGVNGDIQNDLAYENIYAKEIPIDKHLIFKHLSGEYFTSSAFGMVMLTQLLGNNRFSNQFFRKYHPTTPLKKVLFHNHFQNKTHSLILLEKC